MRKISFDRPSLLFDVLISFKSRLRGCGLHRFVIGSRRQIAGLEIKAPSMGYLHQHCPLLRKPTVGDSMARCHQASRKPLWECNPLSIRSKPAGSYQALSPTTLTSSKLSVGHYSWVLGLYQTIIVVLMNSPTNGGLTAGSFAMA